MESQDDPRVSSVVKPRVIDHTAGGVVGRGGDVRPFRQREPAVFAHERP